MKSKLTFAVFVSDEVTSNAEVFVFGVVYMRGLSVPLGPQNLSFPFEFNEQGLYLEVFLRFQPDFPINDITISKSVAIIDRVIDYF